MPDSAALTNPVRQDRLANVFVDRFDRVPTQIVELRHRLHTGCLQQLLARPRKPLGYPLVTSEPVQPLQSRAAAAIAPHAPTRHMQHHPTFEQRKITHSAYGRLMDLRAAGAALLAVHHFGVRLPIQPERAVLALRPLHTLHPIALPATQRFQCFAIQRFRLQRQFSDVRLQNLRHTPTEFCEELFFAAFGHERLPVLSRWKWGRSTWLTFFDSPSRPRLRNLTSLIVPGYERSTNVESA